MIGRKWILVVAEELALEVVLVVVMKAMVVMVLRVVPRVMESMVGFV